VEKMNITNIRNAIALNQLTKTLRKYPKAKKIAVENFTDFGSKKMSFGEKLNLANDAAAYRWNADTVKAIEEILNFNAHFSYREEMAANC
jgi:hypothetical protein